MKIRAIIDNLFIGFFIIFIFGIAVLAWVENDKKIKEVWEVRQGDETWTSKGRPKIYGWNNDSCKIRTAEGTVIIHGQFHLRRLK